MKTHLKFVVLLAGLLGCAHDATGPIEQPIPKGGVGVSTAIVSANNDTLTYTLKWGSAANATSYQVTVNVTGKGSTGTLGLPNAQSVTDTTIRFTAVNATYDSLEFTAKVTSWRGTLSNPIAAVAVWHWVRRPGPPGPIIIDSLNMISFVGIDIHANHIGYENFPWMPVKGAPLYQGGEITRIDACAYFKFSDGTVTKQTTKTPAEDYCLYNYRVGYSEPSRSSCVSQSPLWNPDGSLLQPDFHCNGIANAKLQAWADAQCIDWSSSDTTSVTVDTPSCPAGTNTQLAPVPDGRSSIITAKLRKYGHSASIKLGW